MSNTRFDLVDIVEVIQRRRRFIITVTLICVAIGLLFHFISRKKYEAKAAFFVSNPLYADRSSMFSASDSRYLDYFGDEDDIDRVVALASSDTIETQAMRNTGYDKAYGIDLNDPYKRNELKLRFRKRLDVKRTEYKLLEISFTDKDPVLAANVTNEMVKGIGEGYAYFYNSRKFSAFNSIKAKIREVDSSIYSLTDTLARLRNISGIYDVISPSRLNLITGNVKGNGKDQGLYVELIQNFEADKDMLVADKAKYVSLLNQYSTGVGPQEMPLLHVITSARPPVDPANPSIWIILAVSIILGLAFSISYVLLTGYYGEVVTKRNAAI
jgi:uncharacterized protein involved in exopolysaccharide biosynthesis